MDRLGLRTLLRAQVVLLVWSSVVWGGSTGCGILPMGRRSCSGQLRLRLVRRLRGCGASVELLTLLGSTPARALGAKGTMLGPLYLLPRGFGPWAAAVAAVRLPAAGVSACSPAWPLVWLPPLWP